MRFPSAVDVQDVELQTTIRAKNTKGALALGAKQDKLTYTAVLYSVQLQHGWLPFALKEIFLWIKK